MAKKEKTLAIIAGVHGNEIGSIITAYRLKDEIENKEFAKEVGLSKIDIYPAINTTGIIANTREQVYNNSDLNRGWAYRTEHRDELQKICEEHDFIIDIHSSSEINGSAYINPVLENAAKLLTLCKKNDIPFYVEERNTDTMKMKYNTKDKFFITWEMTGMRAYSNIIEVNVARIKKLVSVITTLPRMSSKVKFVPPIVVTAPSDGVITNSLPYGTVIESTGKSPIKVAEMFNLITGKVTDVEVFLDKGKYVPAIRYNGQYTGLHGLIMILQKL